MEEDGQRQGEKCLSSVVSRSSSHTSGFDAGSKARTEDEGWQGEGEGWLFSMGTTVLLLFVVRRVISCVMLIMLSQPHFLYGLYVDVFFVLDTFQ